MLAVYGNVWRASELSMQRQWWIQNRGQHYSSPILVAESEKLFSATAITKVIVYKSWGEFSLLVGYTTTEKEDRGVNRLLE